ncbi:MAG: acetolactate synthase large subunit, partial [Thermovirga sp.]|nr:acetolactate synthase large subunit [Thermovirga sp.]
MNKLMKDYGQERGAMYMTGARIILEMLRSYGVKCVFGLPGETTLGWYLEWKDFPDVEYVLARDERSASFMAEA